MISMPNPEISMAERASRSERRRADPYLDRRSGEDRRDVYLVDYFAMGGPERRTHRERRRKTERRQGCVRISRWSSVCVGKISK
jgi:hypothetical protein